ncbi:Bifunctional inhibitor/lipid-transfer protein/seed storage 2S albumin superfamily protein [Zea mays]|nr:Bifunctional inhibitor/lipid-transfer protein/seed storage 2S albumin superfamily protein [Zea mays]ONM51628.1 Bifunctional inhibitor/lipid-transfer protein/seed storage 2S albumin superfamily protein [Zea mays]ONM51630.1 Bifunctional inhibitor/lipid-transfer protein/seed storage 2S albumin superfamily protein [Zea mays]ONM51631.1 Bifunctional inhibitor/lipid-transfer protein/seed storage 2S albumin superfamily protein [Zea mays]ONM51634.1 Bifunctional inhibitor/lipid-transfer protein/seed s
MSPCRN